MKTISNHGIHGRGIRKERIFFRKEGGNRTALQTSFQSLLRPFPWFPCIPWFKLTCFVLLFCGIGLMAAPKIAVTGDISLADLVTAEFSGKGEWELLERSGINKVLTEQGLAEKTLSSQQLRRYFPHVDFWVIVHADRLVIFNAKNGYRLADRKITGRDMAPGLVLDELLKSIRKKEAEDTIYLSTISVREVGVSRALKPKIDEFVDAVESRLLENPKVQMLERSRLGLVNEERKLAEKQFELVPSTRLLTFEFESGSENETVDIKVLVGDLNRKNFGRIERKDVFSNISAMIRLISLEIEISLEKKEPMAAKQSLIESDRFFRESEELWQSAAYDKALTRIQAALALEPDKPEFLEMELRIRCKLCGQMRWDAQRGEASEKIADLYETFMQAEPNSRLLLTAFRSYTEIFQIRNSREFEKASEETRARMRAVAARYRVQRNISRQMLSPSFLPEKMYSVPDLKHYLWQLRNGDSLRFFDLANMLKELQELQLQFYRSVDDFLRRNPEKTEEVNRLLRSLYGWIIQEPMSRKSEWTEYIQGTPPLLDLLENSPITMFRNECIAIRFILRVEGKTVSPDMLALETDRYLNDLVKFSPTALEEIVMTRKYPESDLQVMNNRVLFWLSKYMPDQSFDEARGFVIDRIRRMADISNEKLQIPLLIGLFASDNGKALSGLLAEKEALRRFAAARIYNMQYGDWLNSLTGQLLKQQNDAPEIAALKHEIFAGLNKDMMVYYSSWEKLLGKSSAICLGAAEFEGELYLVLALRGEKSGLYLVKYSPESGCRILSEITGLNVTYGQEYESEASVYLAASDKVVVVPGRSALHLFELKSATWRTIDDPIGKNALTESAVLGDRIYLLYSERGAVDDRRSRRGKRTGISALISYNLEGKDRVTHFHTNRADKLNMMDYEGAKGEVFRNLAPLDEDRLVFQSETGVWEFHTGTGVFRKIFMSDGKSSHYVRMTVANRKIYITSTDYSGMFSAIDPVEGSSEVLLGFGPVDLNEIPLCRLDKNFLIVDRQNGYRNANHPFFRQGDLLYIGGLRPCCLNLTKPEESPVLVLPPCFQLLQIGSKIAFISRQHLFIISEKEVGL